MSGLRADRRSLSSPVLLVTNHSVQDRSRISVGPPPTCTDRPARSRRAGRTSSSVYASMRPSALWGPGRAGSLHPTHPGQRQLQGHRGRRPKTLLLPLLDAQRKQDLSRLAPEQAQPTPAGGAPEVTPGARHTGRRQSGWATSFEHGILCRTPHEEAVEASFYLLPCEDLGPGGSAPDRVWMRFFQTPKIPLPLALSFFRGGVT